MAPIAPEEICPPKVRTTLPLRTSTLSSPADRFKPRSVLDEPPPLTTYRAPDVNVRADRGPVSMPNAPAVPLLLTVGVARMMPPPRLVPPV